MTAPELRAALASLGMSQRDFATLWNLPPNTVSRWCNGRHPVPPWVETAVRATLLLAG